MTIEIGFLGFGRIVCDDPCGIGCSARSTMRWGEKRIARKAIERGWYFNSVRYEWSCLYCFAEMCARSRETVGEPSEQEVSDKERKALEKAIDAFALAMATMVAEPIPRAVAFGSRSP